MSTFLMTELAVAPSQPGAEGATKRIRVFSIDDPANPGTSIIRAIDSDGNVYNFAGAQGIQGDQGLIWEGAWDSGTTYSIDDAVEYNGSAYIALTSNTNKQPDTNPSDWDLLAAKGDTGAPGAVATEIVVDITDPTEIESVGLAANGAYLLVKQNVGSSGTDMSTTYIYDTDGPAKNSPYVMNTGDGGTTRWVAMASCFTNGQVTSNSGARLIESAEQTKLSGIETGAEVNQTDSEIKTQYENNADTNAFTDADETKLDGIEALADVNQTDSEIKTQYENNADTNAFTDADETKLDGIAAGAEVNPDLVSQAEAEAGTATTERIWSSQRVAQAIAALESGGTPTKEFFFSPGSDTANQDNYSIRTAGSTAQTFISFMVPHDFTSIVSCDLIGFFAGALVAVDIDLNSSYGQIGEDRTNHQESDTGTTYTENANELVAIDLSVVLSSLSAGDVVGINIDHNAIGTTARYITGRLRYS